MAPAPERPRNPPSGSGGQPSDAGLHDLTTSSAHSTRVTTNLVGSYPTFSPLPASSNLSVLNAGGHSLLRFPAVTDSYPLGSGTPFVARTFLRPFGRRQTGPLFRPQSYTFSSQSPPKVTKGGGSISVTHFDTLHNIPRLKKMLADGGYRGQKLIDEAKRKLGIEFSVVLRPDESPKKFSVVPIRWIVERSFSRPKELRFL